MKDSIEVNGEPVAIEDHPLRVADLDSDMTEIAAQMSYWGRLWGAAEAEKELADARYRTWRAEYGKQTLDADPKLAEWKIKQKIESSPNFMSHKEAIATAQRNTVILKTRFESFRAKASILQSKGAMARAEIEATGMSTRSRTERAKTPEDKKKAEEIIRTAQKKKQKANRAV